MNDPKEEPQMCPDDVHTRYIKIPYPNILTAAVWASLGGSSALGACLVHHRGHLEGFGAR